MVRPHAVADGPVQEPEPVPAVTGSGVAGWLRDALPVLHNISVTVLSGGDWSWAIALVQLGVPRVHCMALRNEALASLRRLTSFVPGLQCVDQPPTPCHIVCGHVTISADIPLFVSSVPSFIFLGRFYIVSRPTATNYDGHLVIRVTVPGPARALSSSISS